jgi:hypothetical protein
MTPHAPDPRTHRPERFSWSSAPRRTTARASRAGQSTPSCSFRRASAALNRIRRPCIDRTEAGEWRSPGSGARRSSSFRSCSRSARSSAEAPRFWARARVNRMRRRSTRPHSRSSFHATPIRFHAGFMPGRACRKGLLPTSTQLAVSPTHRRRPPGSGWIAEVRERFAQTARVFERRLDEHVQVLGRARLRVTGDRVPPIRKRDSSPGA